MNNNRECAQYLKSQRAYSRCMAELRKKWKSYGKVAGRITLKDTTEEERRALGGIVGKNFYEKEIRFSFADFEQGLQRTRFAPVDMKAVLEAYFGETLSTNQGQRQEEQRKKQEFLENLRAGFQKDNDEESLAFRWFLAMEEEKKYGYQLLIREYGKDEQQTRELAENVGNALVRLCSIKEEETEIPLAVFAADISGNPHYFDRGSTAGQLLLHGICFEENTPLPQSAHQWREILMGSGIVPDNISSMVHAYGLRLRTKEGWHPAYEAFCQRREPYVITMENMRGILGAAAAASRVYIVENEMVFSYLVEKLREAERGSEQEQFTLLCTSGQLRAVALELIPLILSSGAEIYYSGDIDPDGIGIADRLWQKFGDRIHIWRMSPEDYERSISGETIGDTGILKLGNIQNPLLAETAEAVKEKGLAAYQENLLEELRTDFWITGTK